MVLACGPPQHGGAQPQRVGPEGQGHRGLPHGQLPGTLQHPRVGQVRVQGLPHEAADSVAGSPLPRGREAQRSAPGSCGQVQGEEEVPHAQDNMGRGAEDTLLQGEDQGSPQRVLPARPLPQPKQEAGVGPGHGSHPHPSGKLVQKQTSERSSSCSQKQVSYPLQYSFKPEHLDSTTIALEFTGSQPKMEEMSFLGIKLDRYGLLKPKIG